MTSNECKTSESGAYKFSQLAEYTLKAKYARYNKAAKRRETWEEQVERVIDGTHRVKFNNLINENPELERYLNIAKKSMLSKKVLGSQRILQFGGPAALKKEMRIYNCAASYVDRVRVFQETMYVLLCGTGAGFSVQKHHIAKLPCIAPPNTSEKMEYTVPDTIEGWADSVGVLLSSFFVSNQTFPEYFGKDVVFDFTQIRPKGSAISHIGGKAPGHLPLKKTLQKIKDVVYNCFKMGLMRLRPIDAYDIITHVADAVLAGGVRRSALLTMFSLNDEEMMAAKTGSWFIDNPQRGRSNNSAVLLRGNTTHEQFAQIMESVKEFGEPGFIWADDLETLFNPCLPKDTWITTSEGVKRVEDLIGKQFTALVNGREHKSTDKGFFFTGRRIVYKITTQEGYEVCATPNHKFLTANGWVELSNLENGDKLLIHEHKGFTGEVAADKFTTLAAKGLAVTVTGMELVGVKDVYDCTIPKVHCFDANGFISHNCVEVGLYGYDDKGDSGFQLCNLSEINMKVVETPEQFYEACEAASILGTFQAAYTNFGYVTQTTIDIVRREALLGVSMTGMMDSPAIAFDPEILAKGANLVKEVNIKLAKLLGIHPAARTTCIKPAGTTSCILGTSSGIHPRHAKRYFRRVQANKGESTLAFFRKYNPNAVQESVWSNNGTDDVVTFLCKAPDTAQTKSDVNALELLSKVKLVQKYWVNSGKNSECCVQQWLSHNVSNTINVSPNEWVAVTDFIYENRQFFTGVSILPNSGDKDYAQAPFQTVIDAVEIAKKYGAASVFASGLIVHAHNAFDGDLYKACACFLGIGEKIANIVIEEGCTIENIQSLRTAIAKKLWLAQAQKFTDRYFGGDKKIMTYCLKDVDAWKTWCDLSRTYENVPWDEFFEDEDVTKPMETVACSGGTCELISFS